MSYYFSIYRRPKQGNFIKVRDAAIASRNQMPNRGFVTQTISNPAATQNSNMIVSTTIFESAADMDKVLDYSDSNDEITKRIEAVDTLCETSGSVVGHILQPATPPDSFSPKICVRDMVVAGDGNLASLIEVLSDFAQEDWGVPKAVSVSVALGAMNSNQVRATGFFESMADFEIARGNMVQSSLVPKIIDLRAAPHTRIVSRILSFTR